MLFFYIIEENDLAIQIECQNQFPCKNFVNTGGIKEHNLARRSCNGMGTLASRKVISSRILTIDDF